MRMTTFYKSSGNMTWENVVIPILELTNVVKLKIELTKLTYIDAIRL